MRCLRSGFRTLILSVQALALLYPCSAVLGAEANVVADSSPMKVATFNLLHGGVFSGLTGDDQYLERRLAIVESEFHKLNIDIIGIQEASTSRARGNTAARLATALGFHYVYAPASFHLFPYDSLNAFISWILNFSEGPAIISRFPIASSQVYPLPRCGRFTDPRVLLTATIRTPRGSLLVASTHTSGDPCQHRYIADVLRRIHGDTPALVMGDFNAPEHGPAMVMFTPEHGFIDTFRTLNNSVPGLTCYQQPYAATRTVSRRIDYLFMLPGKAKREQVYASKVFLDVPSRLPNGQSLWPSDHYGVYAEISLG